MNAKRPALTLVLLLAFAVIVTACGQTEPERESAAMPAAMPAVKDGNTETMAATGASAAASEPTSETAPMETAQAGTLETHEMTGTMASKPMVAATANGDDHAMAEPMPDTMAKSDDEVAAAGLMTGTKEMATAPLATEDRPGWLHAELTDVTTGRPFTIADHLGKVVLVETLAVWCPKCMQQQGQVVALHEALGERDDFLSVGLGVDLNESAAQLKDHAESHGFDWVYAIATPEVAREIGQLYGAQFLNPTATPMLIVDRQGAVHPLPFGIKSAEELYAATEPFLN